jgi:hypothetical protein
MGISGKGRPMSFWLNPPDGDDSSSDENPYAPAAPPADPSTDVPAATNDDAGVVALAASASKSSAFAFVSDDDLARLSKKKGDRHMDIDGSQR